MSRYLLEVTEKYRADTENEALQMIQDAKESSQYVLKKQSYTYKEAKQKGEVVDCWWNVSLTKVFDNEKEPSGCATIEYNTERSTF